MREKTIQFQDLIKNEGVTVLNQTPSGLYMLTEVMQAIEPTPVFEKLRYVILGGERLIPMKVKWWKTNYPSAKIVNMYGPTEVTVVATLKEIVLEDMNSSESPIGKPLSSLNTYLFDSNRRLVPKGVTGEIYIEGAGVSRGYLNREELTKDRFVPNPYDTSKRLYRSGDLAMLSESGDLLYKGRSDDQVKIRGYRIELGEIQSALLSIEEIQDCAVIVKELDGLGKQIVAYIITESKKGIGELRGYLNGLLPSYMIPSFIVPVERFELTSNGKINTRRLPVPEVTNNISREKYVAPDSEVEIRLAKIWEEIFKSQKIGINDDFFLEFKSFLCHSCNI